MHGTARSDVSAGSSIGWLEHSSTQDVQATRQRRCRHALHAHAPYLARRTYWCPITNTSSQFSSYSATMTERMIPPKGWLMMAPAVLMILASPAFSPVAASRRLVSLQQGHRRTTIGSVSARYYTHSWLIHPHICTKIARDGAVAPITLLTLCPYTSRQRLGWRAPSELWPRPSPSPPPLHRLQAYLQRRGGEEESPPSR